MRERSFWGWGWADKFPDGESRRGVGQMAAALLGIGVPEPSDPPRLEAISVEPSRLGFDDVSDRIRHTYGRAFPDVVRGFRGDFRAAPDRVEHPASPEDVARVLAFAEERGAIVVPYGGGTSVVGGVEAPRERPSISLDLGRLDRVLEVDPISRAARIQAGATGPAIEAQLAPHGLTLRHFPQSFEFSTLGGWIATRAGGHFATVLTHIDDLVESVTMIAPAGVYATRRLPASGAGPDPNRLAIGSEGILGVITEAWVRLQVRPRWRASGSFLFREYDAAVDATRAMAQSGLHPANCRLLDAREALMNRVPADGKHVLLVAFESADHALDAWIARAQAIAEAYGGSCPRGIRATDTSGADATASSWKDAFLDAPYLQTILVSLGLVADTFETACTWDRFPALHREVTGAVTEALGGGSITCRFTHVYPDGPAPYFTFVASPGGRDVLEVWAAAKRAAMDAIGRAGGTITHHHAVGRTHRPGYDRERPELFARALAAAKRELDPRGVLNPGVLI